MQPVTTADVCLLDEWTNRPKDKVWDLPEGFSHSPPYLTGTPIYPECCGTWTIPLEHHGPFGVLECPWKISCLLCRILRNNAGATTNFVLRSKMRLISRLGSKLNNVKKALQKEGKGREGRQAGEQPPWSPLIIYSQFWQSSCQK